MNYYEILQVSQNASNEVIRAAYKSLMQRYHPDKNVGNTDQNTQKVLEIQLAYETLSDPIKREAYDNKINNKSTSNVISSKTGKTGTLKESNSIHKKIESPVHMIGLIIIVLTIAGAVLFVLEENRTKEITKVKLQKEREQEIFAIQKRIEAEEKEKEEQEKALEREKERKTRTYIFNIESQTIHLHQYPEDLKVQIPPYAIILGKIDNQAVKDYFIKNYSLISKELDKRLMKLEKKNLIGIHGESYLKGFIKTALNDIAGIDIVYRDNLESKGVEEIVFLDESFGIYTQ